MVFNFMSTLYSNLIIIQQHFHNSRVGRKRFFPVFRIYIVVNEKEILYEMKFILQSKCSLLRNFHDLKLCLLLKH